MTIKSLSLVQFHPSRGGIKLKSTNKKVQTLKFIILFPMISITQSVASTPWQHYLTQKLLDIRNSLNNNRQ